MSITITLLDTDDEGETIEVHFPARYEACPRCHGDGSHVNPSIDGHGITAEEMGELGDDFRDDYMAGVYNVPCHKCGGRNVVPALAEDLCEPEELAHYYRLMQEAWESYASDRAERRPTSATTDEPPTRAQPRVRPRGQARWAGQLEAVLVRADRPPVVDVLRQPSVRALRLMAGALDNPGGDMNFANDMELRNQRALVKNTERQILAAEVAIADHQAATLRQRKRRTLLRVQLRQQLKRLNRLESKQ